ncbi:MAG: putative transport system permease protein [Sphingomonadales bacterium]|jgi:putative ABC transport system permease protein|nr:putative transport system permease protein [Sphingomonadales bacterium]
MLRHYLTVSLRILARNRTYAAINIIGLALGLAACMLILLFVRWELSYDSGLPDAGRVFQIQEWFDADGDQPAGSGQMTSIASALALRKDFPQFERVVYLENGNPTILQDGQATASDHFLFADGPIFDILELPFVRGDRRTALAGPGSLVLTQSEALKRFGNADPMGKTLTLMISGKPVDYRVTGIVADPRHSHLALSIVARYDPVSYWSSSPSRLSQWLAKNGYTYAKLKPGLDIASVTSQMPAWKKRNIPDEIVAGKRSNPGDGRTWKPVPIGEVHLGEAQRGSMTPGSDRRTIATFAIVALLILGVAIVNFTNLATARASRRAREVALRKVVGASRRQLIVQFLSESILLAALAMVIALALIELLLPSLNHFLQADMRMAYLGRDGLLSPVVMLVFLVGAAGGLYPAFYLSRFQPAKVLKANVSASDGEGSGRLRGILVVFQFAVSIGLIICTAIIYSQTVYARTADPGYRRDGLMQIDNVNRRAMRPVIATLLNEISRIDGVKSAGRSTIGVATFPMENLTVQAPGAAEGVELNEYRVDTNFFRTMGIRLLAGRSFVEGRAMDDSTLEGLPPDPAEAKALAGRGYGIVLNAFAARRLGFLRPADAVGKVLMADDGDVEANGRTPVTIIGIVQDSRFRSIREPVEPIVFVYDRYQPSWLLVRSQGSPVAVRDAIERVWKRVAPDVPFHAELSDDIVRKLYDADEARAEIFAAFSALAIVIGCLGLFGLAAFAAERRTKEIGIRKVLGARARDIVALLAWQFSKPVLVANLIAWPVAWWVMRDWLNGFDARVDLGPGPFLLAGFLALAIALVTIGGHALRVARANPIHALRYE